jgi:hypothetical protein
MERRTRLFVRVLLFYPLTLQQPSDNYNSQPAGPNYFFRVIHNPF